MTKNRIVRFLLMPLTMPLNLSGAAAVSEMDRIMSVDGSTPKERLISTDFASNAVGLCIPVVMAVFALINWASGSTSLALTVVIAPLIFFFSSFVWMARRTIPASRDMKRWEQFKDRGELHLYAPNKDSARSIPQDRDFVFPIIFTVVVVPLVIASGVLAF